MPTVLHSLLVGGIDYSQDATVMCEKPKMARSEQRDGVMMRIGVEEV